MAGERDADAWAAERGERLPVADDRVLMTDLDRVRRKLREARACVKPTRDRAHVPAGHCVPEGGPGWLLKLQPRTPIEELPWALYLQDAMPELLDAVSQRAGRFVGDAWVNGGEHGWRAVLAAWLYLGKCVPDWRAIDVVMVKLSESNAPLPRHLTKALVASVVGPRLERVTPNDRGAGRGKRVQIGIRAAVNAIARALGREERILADVQRVRELLQEGARRSAQRTRGLEGVEAIRRELHLSVGRVRVALDRLERAGEVENRGSSKRPRLYWREK